MLKFLNTRALLTLGLVSIVTSAFLLLTFTGLLPDSERMERDSRLAVAEVLAASAMSSLASGDVKSAEEVLQFAAKNGKTLNSAAIRKADGSLVVQSGDHIRWWIQENQTVSSETQIIVPLFSAGKRWGQTEISYQQISQGGWLSFLFDKSFQFMMALGAVCFVIFYFYLGRMLRHLDPSRTVPDRVRNALDTLAESLLLIDKKGQIVLANQSFAELMDCPPGELLGKSANDLGWLNREHQPVDDKELLPWNQAIYDGKLQRNTPLAFTDANGERHSFLANSSPIMGSESKVNGVLVSLDDVTELEEKEALLNEARVRAESANEAKTNFLANMSHEIRTPMNAVLGFTELMRRNRSSNQVNHDESARYLDTISRNGKHLLALINDILDLSKVEAGEFETEKIPVQAHQVAAEVIEILAVRARDKNVNLTLSIDGEVPETILGDPARLRQILTNLIGNAIKFTDDGGVVTVTQRWEENGADSVLILDVQDSGIGIPEDKLATIFDPFTQAESSTTRRFGGTGLGLTISRKFAQAMDGDILVTSTFGQGSCFSVRLPVVTSDGNKPKLISAEQAQSTALISEPEQTMSWQFDGNRVLVVDDSPENRELVHVVLTEAGINVTQAENGKQGCDLALAEDFELILMDMQMPVMDGKEATRYLRNAGLKTKIYAFTAHALTGFEKEIEDIGCDGYLTKPIDIDHMLSLLAQMLGAKQVVSAQSTAQNRNQISTIENVAIHSRLRDQPRLHSIIESFINRVPDRIEAMHSSLHDNRLDDLADIAHWLKGSAGSVGFDDFTRPAKELELAAKNNDTEQCEILLSQVQSLAARIASPSADQSEGNRNAQAEMAS